MRKFFFYAILSFVLSVSSQAHASSYDLLSPDLRDELAACDVDRAEFDRLLSLSQNKFDQDFGGGWREVSYRDGCDNAAAEIIKAYMTYSTPYAPNKGLKILRWHAGQTKASANKYAEAAALFRGTYDPDPDNGLTWNLYVDATLAFIEGDKDALQIAHDSLAATSVSEEEKTNRRQFLADNPNITMPEGFVDLPNNLSPVKDLLNCFGKPYSQAYGHCEDAE